MNRWPSRSLQQATIIFGCCLVFYLFIFVRTPNDYSVGSSVQDGLWQKPAPDLLDNLSLNETQCEAAFPGLSKSIHDAVASGPFKVKQTGDKGPLQGRIKDGHIHIIYAQRKADLSEQMLNSRAASLQQLHRALTTSSTPLPDTIFSLNFQDTPFGTAWGYSCAADPDLRPKGSDAHSFLMPHFSFWAWRLPFLGSMRQAARAIETLEAQYAAPGDWQQHKIPKAIWRGTAWFNSPYNQQLRQQLLNVAKGKEWADVEALNWVDSGRNATNALPIEEFCRYKYVLHTEGITYSGRFQFLQMCASVVLTPPIQWLQHTTHLIRPLFSSSLDLQIGRAGSGSNRRWVPSEQVRKIWPLQYSPEEANIVFVAPDWSDLRDMLAWLEENPKVAEGIARRQRELFFGGGYFSGAAEACYWRALVRGWAEVAVTEGEGWEDLKGVTFEDFSLTNGR